MNVDFKEVTSKFTTDGACDAVYEIIVSQCLFGLNLWFAFKKYSRNYFIDLGLTDNC